MVHAAVQLERPALGQAMAVAVLSTDIAVQHRTIVERDVSRHLEVAALAVRSRRTVRAVWRLGRPARAQPLATAVLSTGTVVQHRYTVVPVASLRGEHARCVPSSNAPSDAVPSAESAVSTSWAVMLTSRIVTGRPTSSNDLSRSLLYSFASP
jgi:hypothetical protein